MTYWYERQHGKSACSILNDGLWMLYEGECPEGHRESDFSDKQVEEIE